MTESGTHYIEKVQHFQHVSGR